MHEQNTTNIQKKHDMIYIAMPKGCVFQKSKKVVENFTGMEITSGQLKIAYKKYMFCFLKHRDIPKLVENGVFHYGITSDEWLKETEVKVKRIKELDWCDTKIALIRQKGDEGEIRSCVTEFPNIAMKTLKKSISVQYVSGSSEALVPEFYDSCIDCVESGRTLEKNNLIIDQILLNSKTVLIGNEDNRYLLEDFMRWL